MDRSFVEALSDLTTAKEQYEHLLTNPDLMSPVAIVPNGYELVSTEQFYNQPNLYRATFKTDVLDDFIQYVGDHGSQSTSIFIDRNTMQAIAVIDLGTTNNPEWGKHRAILELEQSPEYQTLLKLQSARMDQLNFCDFLEDWSECMVIYRQGQNGIDDEPEKVSVQVAVQTIRNLTLERVKEITSNQEDFLKVSNDYDKLELKSNRGAMLSHFHMTFSPYENFPDFSFKVNVRMSIENGNRMLFRFKIVGLELIQNQISQVLHRTIAETISEDSALAIYKGRISL